MANFDTPKFDLGSVYGRARPAARSSTTRPSPATLLVNRARRAVRPAPRRRRRGLPRRPAQRREPDRLAAAGGLPAPAQQAASTPARPSRRPSSSCRWHHQYLDRQRLPAAHRRPGPRHQPARRQRRAGTPKYKGTFYKPGNPLRPMMPIEYSGAAYRFGHSMIRGRVRGPGPAAPLPIFGQDGYEDLRGNRPFPADLWIDWNYFFEHPGRATRPDDRNMARLIDTQLSHAARRTAADGGRADGRRDRRAGRAQPAARQEAGPALGPGRRRRRWGSRR